MTEKTAKFLDNTPVPDWPCAGGRYAGYGWFFDAHEENTGPGVDLIPDDLFAAMTWARKKGFEYLLLDCDGGEVEGLPRYDW